MHKDVLSKEQVGLLPLLKLFHKDYFLVGGTAIALLINHRRSIDFDLFTNNDVRRKNIKNILEKTNYKIEAVLFEDSLQLHVLINSVKITFYYFPFKIEYSQVFQLYINMPGLLSLAAMKAFALGGRAKWKDYVDMYFLLKNHFSLSQICSQSNKIFGNTFNEKLFRQQLCYFNDINYEETVEFINAPVNDDEIKDFLTEISIRPF